MHREFHGTVFNSIAIANDNQESVIFLLLDLSAAFDTAEIDRQIVYSPLKTCSQEVNCDKVYKCNNLQLN